MINLKVELLPGCNKCEVYLKTIMILSKSTYLQGWKYFERSAKKSGRPNLCFLDQMHIHLKYILWIPLYTEHVALMVMKLLKDSEYKRLREHEEYELGRQMEGGTSGESLLLKGTMGGNLYSEMPKHFRHFALILILLQIHINKHCKQIHRHMSRQLYPRHFSNLLQTKATHVCYGSENTHFWSEW